MRRLPGASRTIVAFFRTPGIYKLYCPIGNHAQQGMTSTITVT